MRLLLERQSSFTTRHSSSPHRSQSLPAYKVMMRWVALAATLFLLRVCWFRQPQAPAFLFTSRMMAPSRHNTARKAIVVASLVGDNTTWLTENFPDWDANIYVMNDQNATLTVERNKGRESTAYLTYIIDNYHDLPNYMVFLHALRYQWHNEDPMYDGVPVLKNLRLSYVDREGYANLRCTWSLGCPSEIRPSRLNTNNPSELLHKNEMNSRDATEAAFASAFEYLFPSLPVPTAIGVPCGAQFALSRKAVIARPRAEYERIRQWLWDTKLEDAISGRVLEYSWHVIMGKPAVFCPDAKTCFCEKFGLCNLDCMGASECANRYRLPQYADLPQGWPENGPGANGWPEKGWWE